MARIKRPRWLRAPELLDYCIRRLHMPAEEARDLLYWFVVDGTFRAWRNGQLLSREEASALRDPRPISAIRVALQSGELALPDDIELLVSDAERAWANHYRLLWEENHPPVYPSADSSKKKTGPKTGKLEETKKAMLSDLEQGPLTREQLQDTSAEALGAMYEVGRTTASEARKAVLPEFLNSGKK